MQPLKPLLDRASGLIAHGRAGEALALTRPLAEALTSVNALSLHARALKALGRIDEALSWDRQTVAAFPASAVAWHNLAATLGDLGRGAEACEAVRAAQARGLDASETWQVYGRALAAVGDLAGAEPALRAALQRAPTNSALASELAEFLWTRHGQLAPALEVLTQAASAGAAEPPLVLRQAGLLAAAGQHGEARRALAAALQRRPDEAAYALALSDLALKAGDHDEALASISAAAINPAVLCQLANVLAAQGAGAQALAAADQGLTLDPGAQPLLNARATALRALGSADYARLCDYAAMVGEFEIERPAAWPTLSAYLTDLAGTLSAYHGQSRHPTDQSLQGGSQTTFRLTGAADPAIQAFFQAIDAPLRHYIAGLGPGDDPLRRRASGGYRLSGAWSVILRAGDFHRDHIHSQGWISSAFYVETPDAALGRPGHEGWLRFGQPPFPMDPPMPADHHVRPAPGKLVLFPAYLWHGTQPFTTAERRVTIAFDVVPTEGPQ